MIKVLIVDDSSVIREYLRHIISSDKTLRVVGIAKDGDEAVKLALSARPDVITMDIQMPRMDGYEATRRIMELRPVPIVVISSTVVPQQVQNTFRAIKAGAVAALEKPKGPGHPDSEWMAAKIIQTVKLMSEVKVVRRFPSERSHKHGPIAYRNEKHKIVQISDPRKSLPGDLCRKPQIRDINVVAVGASTGGPPVIRSILSCLRRDFPAPILFVQHIAPGFIEGMVEWLSKETELRLLIPRHGDRAVPGHAYFGPDGYHIGISGRGDILLSKDSPDEGLRPSVSHLFRSVAESYGKRAAGILLTGMGRDGAWELREIREKGGLTIAQNRESSVVHGMPGEAIRLDAVEYILSPDQIAGFLSDYIK